MSWLECSGVNEGVASKCPWNRFRGALYM